MAARSARAMCEFAHREDIVLNGIVEAATIVIANGAPMNTQRVVRQKEKMGLEFSLWADKDGLKPELQPQNQMWTKRQADLHGSD
jgi:hypothetical protein